MKRFQIFIPSSIGALLNHWHLIEAAHRSGARIIAPSGALLGLDAVRAAAEGTIHRVTMVTRKPPTGLAGSPYLIENHIDVENNLLFRSFFISTNFFILSAL